MNIILTAWYMMFPLKMAMTFTFPSASMDTPNPRSWIFYPYVFSKRLAFRFLIQFELIFVHSVVGVRLDSFVFIIQRENPHRVHHLGSGRTLKCINGVISYNSWICLKNGRGDIIFSIKFTCYAKSPNKLLLLKVTWECESLNQPFIQICNKNNRIL